MYESIITHTRDLPFVQEYLGGGVSREAFARTVESHTEELVASGMSAWSVDLLRRIPPNDTDAADSLLEALSSVGLIGDTSRHDREFAAFRERVDSRFSHLEHRFTSIFPEERRAAFELSLALRPQQVVVAGSYYGFLAVWLLPGLAPEGRMVCVDPDREVSDLARRNMQALRYEARVDVVCDDAIELLASRSEPVDLLVVDAYGSTSHPDPAYHGKAIYGPIVESALPLMQAGATILAHNADEQSAALDRFYRAIEGARYRRYLGTTEHLAVFGL